MDNRSFQSPNEYGEGGKKENKFWRNFGLMILALALAVVTVVII